MRRRLSLLLAVAVLTGPAAVLASAEPPTGSGPETSSRPSAEEGLVDVSGLTGTVQGRSVALSWTLPENDHEVQVLRDGTVLATLPAGSTSYDDSAVSPGATYGYRVASATPGRSGKKLEPVIVSVTLPAYLVGAANRDISPDLVVNTGGFGLGDGTVIPDAIIGRGGQAAPDGERIRARAMVVDDGKTAIAIANLEVTGHFAAYQDGEWGLEHMAELVAARNPRLPVGNILIASDHTHSGPDTLGVWGGPTEEYLDFLVTSVVDAIDEAYAQRQLVTLRAGESDASDLVYNQSCSEALNQSKEPA